MKISVIICTHNPNHVYLDKVLTSLKHQSLNKDEWEIIVIDNKSENELIKILDLSWHPNNKIIREDNLGLIHARITGARQAQHEILVSVDDDTPLYPDYLEQVLRIYDQYPELGVIGGKTIPEYEVTPPEWLHQFNGLLAIRDLGDLPIIEKLTGTGLKNYPICAPLLIAPKKSCMLLYLDHYLNSTVSQSLGRKGDQLSSGEDNDINLFIFKNGYALGYFPELKFIHIIPERRMQKNYLGRLQFNTSKTWIRVLNKYNINPWPPIKKNTVFLRKIKAWFAYKVWKSAAEYIKWRGACGTFEALSEINE